MHPSHVPFASILAAATGFAAPVLAQDTAPEPRSTPIVFTPFVEWIGTTDLSDSPGEVGIVRGGAELEAFVPVGEHNILDVGVRGEIAGYNFDGATGFAPGFSEPIGDAHFADFYARLFVPLSETWAVFVGGDVAFSGEVGADTADSIQYGAVAGARYVFNERLSGSIRVSARTSFEDDALILPIPGISWAINERWDLSTEMVPGIFRLVLAYRPWDHWTVSADAGFETREFRLDDAGAAPGGAFSDTRTPIALAVRWSSGEHVSIQLRAGLQMGQEYRLFDSSGTELSQIETQGAMFAMLGARVEF